MAARKKSKPVAEFIEAQPETAVLDNPATPIVEALVQQTAMPNERQPGEDAEFRGKPDPSGRYPGRENLPEHDLLHTFEPTPERGMVGYHIDGGHRHGGVSVQLVDDRHGLGIRFDGDKPSAEVLEAVKEQKSFKDKPIPSPKWEPKLREWRKRFGGNPIGDRLDMEERTKSAAGRLSDERPKADRGFERF